MAKDRKSITSNGKAAFYASIWPDIKETATKHGWALGLHGSLNSDMDIMAMPWDENASDTDALIQAISDCFTESIFKDQHTVPFYGKSNGRVVYTMTIWSDFYLDINIIDRLHENSIEWALRDWDLHNDQVDKISMEEYFKEKYPNIFNKIL